MTQTVVVIDDERTFVADRADPARSAAYHCRTSTEGFKQIIAEIDATRRISELWLDHDLGGDDTIRDLVRMMVEDAEVDASWPVDTVMVHTANPVGRDWILSTLDGWYRTRQVDALAYGLIKTVEED